MNFDWGPQWIAVAALLALSAVFSASETALFKLSEGGSKPLGPRLVRLLADKQGLLVTLLLGNLLVAILFFAVTSGLAREGDTASHVEVGLLALVTIVLFGEILPKAVALEAPERVAAWSAPLVELCIALLRLPRLLILFVLELALRALGESAREEGGISAESLAEVLEHSARGGLIGLGEADLLAEIVELDGIRVREIMTPRVDMLALDLEAEEDDRFQIVARALARRLPWLPAIRGNPDRVIGVLRMRDLLLEGEGEGARLDKLIEPAVFVPEVASALDLLRVLREKHATEAVVVDEYGGTAGLVTIEHLFEELVGDLRVEGEQSEVPVVALGSGRFRVSGSLSIRDWNEQFGREVVPAGFETVGGFVTALLGRIPRAGDRVRHAGLVTQVHEVRGRRVLSVDMSLDQPLDPPLALAEEAGA